MDLQNIRIFVMCAKHLNFSRVAELTYMSQPSVSKAVSALETEVNGKLFSRNGRNMELTALGEELLPYAESLLAKEDELRGFLHQYHNGETVKPLVVGIAKMLLPSLPDKLLLPLTKAIENFRALHEDVDIKIRYFDEETLQDLIAGDKIDLALTVINKGHIQERVCHGADFLRLDETENFLLYAPSAGQFDSIEALLPHLNCILSVSDQVAMSATYDFLRCVKAPLRVEPCDDWSEVIVKVKNGQGAAVLSGSTAQVAIQCGLRQFSLSDMGITSSMFAIWKHGAGNNVVDFSAVLRNWFSTFSKPKP